MIDADQSRQEAIGGGLIQDSLSMQDIDSLLIEVESESTTEADNALLRVASDGGIEAHAMKGDPSKCPFLMGKLGVGQHVEIGDVSAVQEGRSVKEIREEKRRMRAEAKLRQSDPAPAIKLAKHEAKSTTYDAFEAKATQAILETQVLLSEPTKWNIGEMASSDSEPPISQPVSVKKEVVTKASKVQEYRPTEDGISFVLDSKPFINDIDSKQMRTLITDVPQKIERMSGIPFSHPVLPEVQRVVGVLQDEITHLRVDTLQDISGLAAVAPEAVGGTASHEDQVKEVIVPVDGSPSLDQATQVEAVAEMPILEDQKSQEPALSVQEVLPYFDSDPNEKQMIITIVEELNQRIAEIMDPAYEHDEITLEIAQIVERLIEKLPEQLQKNFRNIIELKIHESVLRTDNAADQRESFNFLGTHEFKFFHHKAQTQLPIKEKAGRYLLALLSKRYAPI